MCLPLFTLSCLAFHPSPPPSAESIAFYSGDRHESATADTRLARAVATAKRRLWWEAWLGAWTNAYSYATILAPALLMAPRYFAGEVRFGDISQVGVASAGLPARVVLM